MNNNGATSMTCICDTVHAFPAGVFTGTCAGCGIGLLLTEEVPVLDVVAVAARVAEVHEAAREDDYEAAHGGEDRLWADVLRAIAAGAPDAVALAREALRTAEVPFAHYRA